MKVDILGVKIDRITPEEAIDQVRDYLYSSRPHYLVTPNPEIIMAAQKDKDYQEILNGASLALADGFGLKLAARYLKRPLKKRITGVDFVWRIAKLAQEEDACLYLFGAGEGVAQKAAERLQKKYPHLRISAESGFRNKNRISDQEIVQDINRTQPKILLVALGFPKQEKWIAQNLPRLNSVRVTMGVGGAFDFIAGRIPRAPKLMRKLGLEWIFRLLVQPWRFNRIITATIKFSWAVIKKGRKK